MSSPEVSIAGALVTVGTGIFCTLLADYLSRHNEHAQDDLIQELRREIKDLKQKKAPGS